MSRYTGPKARINRRFNQEIFPDCRAVERKPYLPGIHGPRLRRRTSEYSVGLNEKQKLRFMYGLTEKQFRLIFDTAKGLPGITSERFMCLLEMRLDSIVYLLGLAKTRRAARQFVSHRHVTVNGRCVDIASYLCKIGDSVGVKNSSQSKRYATQSIADSIYRSIPAWLSQDKTMLNGKIERDPLPEELDKKINGQLIVEFYNR
ncbi:MAG: 30S ribosomal protein S4 [Puniceicoccales bacterium]|jgi:small subunit ribosomal protein S4|nr:30S ribosomal protein S4 [Puniceicoccales bacterium]